MPSRLHREIDSLIEEAGTLLQAAKVGVRKTANLIGKLRTFADEAHDAGKAKAESQLRQLADELEKRLMAP